MFTPTSTWACATGEQHKTTSHENCESKHTDFEHDFPRFVQSFNLDNLGPE